MSSVLKGSDFSRRITPPLTWSIRIPEPQTYIMPDGRQFVLSEQQAYDPITRIQHYTFHEHWLTPQGLQEKKKYRGALRYVFSREMEALLYYNGFQIRACYGSWQQEPLIATSRYMIYICHRRPELLEMGLPAKTSLQNLPGQHLKSQVTPFALTDGQCEPQVQQRIYHADLIDAAQVDGAQSNV